ncbi:unnamed protein product [Effrenium voratum]|uniref:Uncharacterized protein n=1 Tax=Effrenium voratum TaxID=2562239 RepID=A0AA36NLQ9_9DINO|nr:unnamed protein product [Effrenium voratum]
MGEMLQWIKLYFDRTCEGGGYNSAARRFCENPPDWARPLDGSVLPSRRVSSTAEPKVLRPGRPSVVTQREARERGADVAVLQDRSRS